jgi:hypothetical protein
MGGACCSAPPPARPGARGPAPRAHSRLRSATALPAAADGRGGQAAVSVVGGGGGAAPALHVANGAGGHAATIPLAPGSLWRAGGALLLVRADGAPLQWLAHPKQEAPAGKGGAPPAGAGAAQQVLALTCGSEHDAAALAAACERALAAAAAAAPEASADADAEVGRAPGGGVCSIRPPPPPPPTGGRANCSATPPRRTPHPARRALLPSLPRQLRGAPAAAAAAAGPGPSSSCANPFDAKIDKTSSDMYFHYYGMLQHQQNMLQVGRRMERRVESWQGALQAWKRGRRAASRPLQQRRGSALWTPRPRPARPEQLLTSARRHPYTRPAPRRT